MLPGQDRLREIAQGAGGSLVEVPYAVLLSAIALEKRSCIAVLSRQDCEKRVFFEKGAPVECLSNLLHETFGRFLVGKGKLREDQFELAFAQASAVGLRLGEVLVGMELLTREELSRLLYQNLARKLLDAFTWHEGTYQLLPDPPAISDPPKINVPQLVVAGVARFAPQQSVDAAIGTLVGKKLALHPSPPFSLEQIRLTERHSHLAAALEMRPRIDELAVSAKLPFEELSRVLYALWLLGTVVSADQVPAAPRPAPAALDLAPPPEAAPPDSPSSSNLRRPTPPDSPSSSNLHRPPPPDSPSSSSLHRPTPSPASSAEAPAAGTSQTAGPSRREELRRAFDTQRGQDAFDLLGVPDDANDEAIRNHFISKARSWAPWQFDGEPGDVDRATALFLQAASAYGELTNRTTREALQRTRRVTGQAVMGRPSSQVFAIRTDVVDAERKHRRGAELLAAGDYKQALSLLGTASECDPQNGTWAAEVAYCKYMAGGRANPAAALGALETAIRIDDEAGLAYFYSGEVLRAKGDAALAEKFYRKAAKLMGSDKRPAEALKSLGRAPAR